MPFHSTSQRAALQSASACPEKTDAALSVTLLCAARELSLAKRWTQGGKIIATANAAWFKAGERPFATLHDILHVIQTVEKLPRVALVKEVISPDADAKRLRRKCVAGVDEDTDEKYPPGLRVVPKKWLALDIEKLARPDDIDWRDGEALAEYVRSLLPQAIRRVACVWQFSGSSGHPSKRGEIRLHLFFMLSEPVLPKAWKNTFAHLSFVDLSVFDNVKIIFTAAPVIECGEDPIKQRHGILSGEPVVRVPADVKARSEGLEHDKRRPKRPMKSLTSAPMLKAAAAFVEIIAASNILRSHHPAYHGERARRLSFCWMISTHFGVTDADALEAAFQQACIGDNDPNGDHDIQEALGWAARAPPNGRTYSVRKLLRDASVTLSETGNTQMAQKAARLAIFFSEREQEKS